MVEQVPRVSVEPTLRFLYSSRIEIDPPQFVGQSPCGERRIINIKGGLFSGPRLSGRVLPGGADWQIIRRDGVAVIEARYTLETSDGALIYICNPGIRHGPPEVIDRLAAGEPRVQPDPFRRELSCPSARRRHSHLRCPCR